MTIDRALAEHVMPDATTSGSMNTSIEGEASHQDPLEGDVPSAGAPSSQDESALDNPSCWPC